MQLTYQALAQALDARQRCEKTGNDGWRDEWHDRIEWLMREHMPSGSGVDCGTRFDWDASTPNRLVLSFSFHHMNAAGYYDGWTEHKAVISPDFVHGFDLRVTGRNRNAIKDCLGELYHSALSAEFKGWPDRQNVAA